MSDQVVAPAGAEAANSASPEATPDLSNMTGAQAKAWVEAQKAREAAKGEKARNPDGKFAGKEQPKQPQSPMKEAAAAAAEKRRLKIDDQEVDEDEVVKVWKERKGHQQAANQKLQEGLAARKQAEQFIAMMKDPEKFFDVAAKLGHTPRELAEKYLARQLQDELLDPKEKEAREIKAKLKHYEDLERRAKEEQAAQEHRLMTEKFAKDYNEQFVKALQETNLPPTKEMVASMAKYIARAAKLKYQMTASEAAQLVREDLQTSVQRLTGNADAETLLKLLGDEVANKVRKYDSEKLKDPNKNLFTPSTQGEPRARQKSGDKRMTAKEWREYNRRG